MTNQEKDKFICQKLGVCWHEHEPCPNCGYCCLNKTVFCQPPIPNPDFTSEAGRVQLLKLIQKHKDYDDFADRYLLFSHWDEKEKKIYGIPEPLIYDDTGKFRDEVFRWLGGVE